MFRKLNFITFVNPAKRVNLLDNHRGVATTRKAVDPLCKCDDPLILRTCSKSTNCQYRVDKTPVYIRTYGCQMNKNDSDIVGAILKDYNYTIVEDDAKAEIILLMTCAIRDSAEYKIWSKLGTLGPRKKDPNDPLKQIGLLGCMAERLKDKILDSKSGFVDIVAGPDAYRDLPRLFASNKLTNEKAINCLLSFDETYSDIRPITQNTNSTAFVSITRGCDNLCSYCIVPFTRGKERSRPIKTILEEIRGLVDLGIKEVTLLGQNVNSYRDISTDPGQISRHDLIEDVKQVEHFAEGFKTVYKPRIKGLTFDVLLEEVAKISPELRVRFTSPHPKDFNDDVIEIIAKYPNISRCIHLPAQSGSNRILDKMRRGYTKESYLELVAKLRASIKDVALTSDFIAGFCGESEQDHKETMDLIKKVDYTYIFAFPYSMRNKTHAYHKMDDDVDLATKKKRTDDILRLFRTMADQLNQKLIGTRQLVLVESDSRRSLDYVQGRIDTNIKTILPKCNVFSEISKTEINMESGDYVVCEIIDANSQTLKAKPLYITTQADFNRERQQQLLSLDKVSHVV